MNPPNSAQMKANEPADLKKAPISKGALCGTCESINNTPEGLQAKELATSSASTKSDSAISSTSSLCSSNQSSSSSSPSLIAVEDERASSSSGNHAETSVRRKSKENCEQLTGHVGDKTKLETNANRCHPKAQIDTEASLSKHVINLNESDLNWNYTLRQRPMQHYQQATSDQQQHQLYMGHQQAAVYATPVGCNQVHIPYQGFYNPVGSHYFHQTQQPQSAFYTAISPAHLIRHPAPLFGACIDHVARNRPLFSGSHDLITRSSCLQQQQYVQTNLAQYKISRQTPEPMQYMTTLNNADKAGHRQDFLSDRSGRSQTPEVSDEAALDDAVTKGRQSSRSCDGDNSEPSSSSPSSPAISSSGACCRSSGNDNELANNEFGDSYQQHLSTAQTNLASPSRSEDDGFDDKQKEEYIDRENSNDVNEKDEPAGSSDEHFHRDPNALCHEDSSYANSPSTPSLSSSSSTSSPSTPSLSASTPRASSRPPSSSCLSSPSSPQSLICPTGSASLMSHENTAENKNNSCSYNLSDPQHQATVAVNSRQPDDTSAGGPDRYTTLAGAPTTSACRQVAYLQPPPARENQQAYYESTLIDLITEPATQLVVTNHQPGQHVAAYAIAPAQQYMPPAVLFDQQQQQHHYSCHPAAHLATQHQAVAPLLLITSMASGGLQLSPMAVVAQPPVAAAYHQQSVMHYPYPEPVIYSQPTTVRSQQLLSSQTDIHQQIHYPQEPFAHPYYVAPAASAPALARPYLPTQTNSTVNCHQPVGGQRLQSADQVPSYMNFPLIDTDQQQAAASGLVDRGPPIVSPMVAFSQLKAGYNLISLLPIDAQPACTRQAYGMDKVWHDEFEELFSQLVSSIVWTLLEVESNPTLRDSGDIIDYRGRYIVRADIEEQEPKTGAIQTDGATPKTSAVGAASSDDRKAATLSEPTEEDDDSDGSSNEHGDAHQSKEEVDKVDSLGADLESDCDSGAPLNSASCCSETCDNSNHAEPNGDDAVKESLGKEDASGKDCKGTQLEANQKEAIRRFPTKFRMFIDSAKVRFCCDNCGHGWTSMKGRVVFWYELFELVNSTEPSGSGNTLIGYCAYKLFGQQCDVCKIENRFERPMWYPEEVTKVLNNLYNKIGQVYFGFKMPAIDKQRRAGKPKTSHNSSLCQACHDGVCTDRK